MKKIRIFAVSAAVLAIVGGTLAFRAKTFGVQYCIGSAYTQGQEFGACPNVVSSTTDNAVNAFYAEPRAGQDCSQAICPSLALTQESAQ